jgi:2-amino-4-hydroxy-6-hydroxymethyldihydropteridine diphosphokinase
MNELAFIAVGSNLGARDEHLAFARREIARLPETRLLDATPPEETQPFGPPGQPMYLNQMLSVETALSPHALLSALQDIEHRAGRTRGVRWGPRTLDLDIVRFGQQVIHDGRLTVPHPGLRDREFWRRELLALGGDTE